VETVAVGEQAGRLSDVLGELEIHYEAMQQARNRLVVSLLWPGFMLAGSIVVLTVMIFVLGLVSPNADPLGLGFTGTSGAILFFLTAAAIVFALVGLVLSVVNDESKLAWLLGVALDVPGLAGCVRAFALQRFSLATAVMSEAGQRVDRTLKVALRATANLAYRKAGDGVAKSIRKGAEVHEVLEGFGPKLFPQDYVEAARIGDETGNLAEVMKKQAEFYREEAIRKLRVVSMAASVSVYAGIAIMIIVAIFRLYAS
jgi:type IV pilus assembly protein PilC